MTHTTSCPVVLVWLTMGTWVTVRVTVRVRVRVRVRVQVRVRVRVLTVPHPKPSPNQVHRAAEAREVPRYKKGDPSQVAS